MKKLILFILSVCKWVCILVGAATLTLVALFAFLLLVGVAGGFKKPKIADKSILVLDLSTGITDKPAPEDPFADLEDALGSGKQSVSLRDVTDSLRLGAKDPKIAAVYIHGSIAPAGYESGYAALKEVREAMLDFRKSGKPVIAYIVDGNKRDIYLTSAASEILMNPIGTVQFSGLAATGTFYKNAEDKYGIDVQPVRHGKYKGAVEPFLRSDFSPANREQLSALFGDIWEDIIGNVATARSVKPESLQQLADSNGIIRATAAKSAGLITDYAYEAQILAKLRTAAGKTGKYDTLDQVSPADYAPEARPEKAKLLGGPSVAVIYAEGEIFDGSGKGRDGIYGDDFAKMLREVQKNDNVKAIVLRVNSPGGSVVASEQILDEMRTLHKSMPIVVSMGTVAASGGYFISTAADHIIAEPDTITGSIGVFGMHLDVQKLANDHGFTFDTVKTAKYADADTITRPLNEDEITQMQDLVDSYYADFLARVSSCRNLTTNQVDALGQGRVWSGTAAKKNGLVDELGGLDLAIADAAKRAKLDNYSVIEYPQPKDLMETLAENLGKKTSPLSEQGMAGRVAAEFRSEMEFLSHFNSANGVYARLPFDLNLR